VILDIFKAGKSKTYFSQIKQLLVCGEVIKPLFVKNWFECFPNIRVANVYGPAEASDDVTMHVMDKLPTTDTILIGRPLQNCRIYILDNYNNVCPIGGVGEICVSGICVGRGYLNDPVKTQAVFMEDPFRPGARMYKTGDLGRFLPSGEIEFFGRRDYQVKIRAQRIELGEIENKLVQIPGVKNAVVIDKLDEFKNKYLCAYVLVDKDREGIRGEEIKNILRKDLPEVMIPSFVMSLREFPLTSNGKVDRKALPDPASQEEEDIVPPSNPAEQKMLDIWKRVLGESAIGVRSNFFEVGGHSLKAAMVVSRTLKEFKVRITLKDIVLNPTIEGLCEVIIQKEPMSHV
jgi:acyl-CoA synthetase (AMP-forming)/AMP-acid ligase II